MQLKRLPKEDNETYSIPTIINQQIPREKIRRVANPRIGFKGGNKKHTVNVCSGRTVQTTKSKVVILGDSHLKGSFPCSKNW